jgi:twitching motility protein PilU
VSDLKELMKKSTEIGMQTFDQALYELYDAGEITYEDALSHADSTNDLRLLIKLASESDSEYLSNAADELAVEEDDEIKGNFLGR